MNIILRTAVAVTLIFCLSGCYNDPLDPTQLGRFEPTPAINVILDTLGVADEPSPTYDGAEEPRPEDLIVYETDYVFGPGDVIRINIFELFQDGQAFVNDYVVTETGRVSIPDVGMVRAAGLTELQLEQELGNILSPTILKEPAVTVTLVQSQSRVYSIVGQGVGQSARFGIPRYTFRLTDAIAQAGGVSEFNVSYIYVSRDVVDRAAPALLDRTPDVTERRQREVFDPIPYERQAPTVSPEEELLDMIAPAVVPLPQGLTISSSEPSRRRELEALAIPDGLGTLDGVEPANAARPLLSLAQNPAQVEWVFEDGQWKPKSLDGIDSVRDDAPPVIRRDDIQPQPIPRDFGRDDLGRTATNTRVIKIPVDRLLAGDPSYNIVIRPGDRITVPVDLIGEFWVMGNVNAQGAIPITGRPITLKQAIATAGGLNAIAWPKKVEVVRRIGRNDAGLMQEETVLVDLQKIARGQQPDFFIKPNDLINVGTHGTSRWQAVLRNAFRATYGFGFIYDRNFADRHFGRTFSDTFF